MPAAMRLYSLLAGLLLTCRLVVADGDTPRTAVEDLQYGEALFHYFQQDYFSSIVVLQVAQQQQRLPNHATEAELLLGGLDLAYGLRNEAGRIFRALLDEQASDMSTRNRAWFYLAKISHERDDLDAALQAISRVDGDMTPATRTAAINLHSLLLMQQGEYPAAIALLEDARNGRHWAPFLNYNLGIALIHDNQHARGSALLEDLGDRRVHDEIGRLLRDKANLALGYSYLREDQPGRARDTLERVRLQGPLSNKALLGTGWADAEQENFGAALVPWLELSGRDTTDPAVQEVLLAVPYAQTRMGLHGRAVADYDVAIDRLGTERRKLDQSIEAIRQGGLQDVLLQEGLGAGNGWMQELYLDSRAPALRYQQTLMASHEFHEAIKNFRDLIVLNSNLSRWLANIHAFDDMLTGRQARFEEYRPAAEQALHDRRLQQLQQRRDTLAAKLATIEASEDAVALANSIEMRQWRQLQQIGQRLQGLPDTPGVSALRDKQQRLHGLLVWQAYAGYKPRLRQAQRALGELDALLADARQAGDSLQGAKLGTPADFDRLRQRIDAHKAQLDRLVTRTESLLQQQGEQLEVLAIAELQRQQQRIDTYLVQARFALAQTYDNALQPATVEDSGQ